MEAEYCNLLLGDQFANKNITAWYRSVVISSMWPAVHINAYPLGVLSKCSGKSTQMHCNPLQRVLHEFTGTLDVGLTQEWLRRRFNRIFGFSLHRAHGREEINRGAPFHSRSSCFRHQLVSTRVKLNDESTGELKGSWNVVLAEKHSSCTAHECWYTYTPSPVVGFF